ncbi:hypothetical protein [Qipengyuania nanhaisediminis]|uniref:hypothetical protein n=1 Tax=Qipengyuania nanhaisediminis TaxID=604088 RepID=UPI0038B314D2
MRPTAILFFTGLAIYSAVLVLTEAATSQDYVRHYFADIDGGRPFLAINTTLSTLLLTGGAILLVFAATASGQPPVARRTWLLWSQAGMLAFLAFDDRFQLQEALAYRIGVADHFIMICWAGIEAALILAFARRDSIPVRAFLLVAAGAGLFAIMMVFDALVAHDAFLRLSLEELAKSWAAAMFFAACWVMARFHCGFDREARTLAQVTGNLAPLMPVTWQRPV